MPAAIPESFSTGRVTAMLTARTAVSTLSAASTALSVIWSTLSSCVFTRSTLPPTLSTTGRTDSSVPLINDERRSTVPARRTKKYATERPIAKRKTARASHQRYSQVNPPPSSRLPILLRAGDGPVPDDEIAVVEDGRLARRD